MANPYFRFKQFTVFHHQCAMKVGIDGVLLGAWASVENSQRVLDIGTGTGLIALMIAQRCDALIDAIDIAPDAIRQATENVQQSPWMNRIELHEMALQHFSGTASKTYDLIVSNPPYFINSTKAPLETRNTARHTDTLTHEELLQHAHGLLNETGRICIILPVIEGKNCIDYALQLGLHCTKEITVFPKPTVVPKRLLLEFSFVATQKITTHLVIESEERHQYSPEFTQLAKDFYLKL
jgi:tRNA1Val (adenine37-N6)-methyltransferase